MIRRATSLDIESIMLVVRDAQLALRELGIDQWQDGYPTIDSIKEDVACGVGYVYIEAEEVVGYAAIVTTGEEAYFEIDNKWLYGNEYVVVHRLCVAKHSRRHGIAVELMHHAASIAREHGYRAFRIDTHRGNIRMLTMLRKLGFEYVGIVHYDSGERVAYELDLSLSKSI